MEKKNSITKALAFFAMLFFLTCCSSPRDLVFADREWHISSYYGQIIDKDTTYRMTFGNVLIPDPLPIISCADSVAKYPGMDRFLSDILHTCRLDSAEILFYTPHMQRMFVRLNSPFPPLKPSSISVQMNDEKPYTMWVRKDDIEDWTREPNEMFTYIYYNNSVDNVGNQHYVFNIRGNNHRLVVVIKFTIKWVYILFIGTHEEYGKHGGRKVGGIQ